MTEVADECYESLGHALETAFLSCVVDKLLERQKKAKAAGMEYYPVAPHEYEPWRPRRHGGGGNSDQLKDLLRNYSCDVEDGGSQPLRSMTWEYRPPDPCGEVGDGSAPPPPAYVHKPGFLPQGSDLPEVGAGRGPLTEAEAEAACSAVKGCAGFTYHSQEPRSPTGKHTMHFKSAATQVTANPEWHSFKRKAVAVDW